MRIAIPGLVQITAENGFVGFADKGGCPHDPKPHWLTPRAKSKVLVLAAIYNLRTERRLSLNDASLPLGGVIANKLKDISPTKEARDAHCHGSHRQGIDVDINRVDMGGRNMTVEVVEDHGREGTLLDFMDEQVTDLNGSLHHTHNQAGELTSIHWRLP